VIAGRPSPTATYATYLPASPPQLSAHRLAERRLCVQGKSGTHLWRMSQLTTCSVLRRDTLWIRPELSYRSRAGQHVQQCSVAWSGVLLSDLQTKLQKVREQSGRLRETGSNGARRTRARNL
jgi:hypothetical protein